MAQHSKQEAQKIRHELTVQLLEFFLLDLVLLAASQVVSALILRFAAWGCSLYCLFLFGELLLQIWTNRNV
ncbi:hypothetical protein IV38_GL000173 [Lactobacillus selangorensis]|uniref:Uncharacterized protein n=1 Tax=Lactobacillus selangorensis TaxID=81857 RepID=A0A0R2GBG6_9LACO|nr:hypothetical protein [Lactobacillus selangorensis]KRN29291.1 hypothetical protein IV38_GL000173 [Lactobacillus selangorensis]KRN34180.1 hypothetical protein IV40_GL000496 [Lactobacillus selangorensis]